MKRERIIEAIVWDCYGQTGGDDELTPLTAAVVDTAMLGVCPKCGKQVRCREWDREKYPHPSNKPTPCDHPYHTARERMERAE